jgi:cytochrome b
VGLPLPPPTRWRTLSAEPGDGSAPPVIDAGQGVSHPRDYAIDLTRSEAGAMKHIGAEMPARPDMIWDRLIRLSGIALVVLLVIAYSTGDEFQETHMMIGYGIAVVVVAELVWEIVRPHHAPFAPTPYSSQGITAQFQNADSLPKTLASLFLILAALPFCALMLMLITHTVWGTTWIDEMHEVAAYFAIGLVVFYVAMVTIASSAHIENRVRRMLGGNER